MHLPLNKCRGYQISMANESTVMDYVNEVEECTNSMDYFVISNLAAMEVSGKTERAEQWAQSVIDQIRLSGLEESADLYGIAVLIAHLHGAACEQAENNVEGMVQAHFTEAMQSEDLQ